MTHKQRVAETIAHHEPDRVPVGEWGIDHDHVSSVIGHHTYWRNRKDTTLALWDGRRDEVVESLKNDCVELVEKLDYDIITVGLVPRKGYRSADPPRKKSEGIWEDKRGRVYKYASSNDSIMCVSKPAEGTLTLTEEQIERHIRSIDDIDESEFELIDFICERYADSRAVLCRNMDTHGCLTRPFGGDFNHQLIITLECADAIKELYEAGGRYNRKIFERCRERGVMLVMSGTDYGMNTGCMYNPQSLRDIFFPMMRMVNADALAHGLIPFYHCCGNIWAIMDDYVDAGFKGYQSIQESAGMDTRTVKERYGKELTLWTGIQCETLIQGTVEEARAEVRRNLAFLMPGGGFIFGSTNSVQFGARTENYLEALEIIRKEGVYS